MNTLQDNLKIATDIFNLDIQKAYIKGYRQGKEDAINDLCDLFKEDWEEQCENGIEDCINWYDWLIGSAKQLKDMSEFRLDKSKCPEVGYRNEHGTLVLPTEMDDDE